MKLTAKSYVLTGAVLLFAMAACSRESEPSAAAPPQTPPPAVEPARTAQAQTPPPAVGPAGPRCAARFKMFDADSDGRVSKAEFAAHPHPHGDAEQIFTARDANQDGFLTPEEFCSGAGRGMGPGMRGPGAGRGLGPRTGGPGMGPGWSPPPAPSQ